MSADEVRLPLTAVAHPDQSFARSMARLRHARGWSQERLAAESGVAEGTIFNLEVGRNGPQLRTAWPISEALEAELGDMIRGELDRYLTAREGRGRQLPERNWLADMPESPR